MVKIANLNLGKDLVKLPIGEKLNIMMHYRAAYMLSKPVAISELEYNTLDTSIKTNEEIGAYNKANRAYSKLKGHHEFVMKQVALITLKANYFKIMWVSNRQAAYMLEAIYCFFHQLPQKIQISSSEQSELQDMMLESLNGSVWLFNEFEYKDRAESERYIAAKFSGSDCFHEQVLELDSIYTKIKTEIDEYQQIEQDSGLIIAPFKDTLPDLLKEAEEQIKWMDMTRSLFTS